MIKVGINGLGRIGRSILRSINPQIFDVKIVNEINPDIKNIAYTANYDTIYGKNKNPYKTKNNYIYNK